MQDWRLGAYAFQHLSHSHSRWKSMPGGDMHHPWRADSSDWHAVSKHHNSNNCDWIEFGRHRWLSKNILECLAPCSFLSTRHEHHRKFVARCGFMIKSGRHPVSENGRSCSGTMRPTTPFCPWREANLSPQQDTRPLGLLRTAWRCQKHEIHWNSGYFWRCQRPSFPSLVIPRFLMAYSALLQSRVFLATPSELQHSGRAQGDEFVE